MSTLSVLFTVHLIQCIQSTVLMQIGRLYVPGVGIDGVESIAIDTQRSLIFTANGDLSTVDVVSFDASKQNIKNENVPMTFIQSIDVQQAIADIINDGVTIGDITSVTYVSSPENDVVLATVAADAVAEFPGYLVYIDPSTQTVSKVLKLDNCFLPDHVTTTSDGSKIIIACEGEPDDNESANPTLNPAGAIAIVDDQDNVSIARFTDFDSGGSKTLPDGVYLPHQDEEFSVNAEPEYTVVDDNDEFAYITLQENNAVAVLNIEDSEIVDIFALGTIDFSETGLDASDKDGEINIATYENLYGLRMPDVIDYFVGKDGKEYVLTANEGDSKDFDESIVGDITLDSDAFPEADTLQLDENLGRLKIVNQLGLNDAGDAFEELYAFSSRDYAIWEVEKDGSGKITDLKLIYSSLDDFEQVTADVIGIAGFNSDAFNPSFDERSDDKGPEPETLIVGKCEIGRKKPRVRRSLLSEDGDEEDDEEDEKEDERDDDDEDNQKKRKERIYAFIGLERVGGIMVYDITKSNKVEYVQYLNSRDFGVSWPEDTRPPENGGDVAPEQLRYIGQDIYGIPLLFAAYTESSSIAIYSVNCGCNESRQRGCDSKL